MFDRYHRHSDFQSSSARQQLCNDILLVPLPVAFKLSSRLMTSESKKENSHFKGKKKTNASFSNRLLHRLEFPLGVLTSACVCSSELLILDRGQSYSDLDLVPLALESTTSRHEEISINSSHEYLFLFLFFSWRAMPHVNRPAKLTPWTR